MYDHILRDITPDKPVLIAGPTASGKSALALAIAETHGGVVVNADASQVYRCWNVITARPSAQELTRAPHTLYGCVDHTEAFSAGHWLRAIDGILKGPERPIIVGGTGLYFAALTEGLADIPATSPQVRTTGDAMSLSTLLSDLDPETTAGLDTSNRARVQRAWEVQTATGRTLADWHRGKARIKLPLSQTHPFVFDAPKDWLTPRIEKRFDQMLSEGALEEVAEMASEFDPSLPAFRAIGVPELYAHLNDRLSLSDARDRSIIATRQYAKRQRTWFRKHCAKWQWISAG